MKPTALSRTWAEIDLDAIAQNVKLLSSRLRPGVQMMAVVKADGYGHGALEAAHTALAAGATWLGVAMLDEGLALRRAGIAAPMLVLGYTAPWIVSEAVAAGVSFTVYHGDVLEAASEAAQTLGQRARVHVKVDTGMGRIGLPPAEAIEFCRRAAELPGVLLEGVFTHFATADAADKAYAQEQLGRLTQVLNALEQEGIRVPVRHAANSAAIMDMPRTHLDLVRAGIAMYGLQPSGELSHPLPLVPAMSWKTRVVHVKTVPAGSFISYGCTFSADSERRIATLPVGYADGYSRSWSNRGQVLLAGQRAPVVGRVCMDQLMVDVTDLAAAGLRVGIGDEAVLLGRQEREAITADELAAGLATISYEIVCLVGKRVPRLYLQEGEVVGVSTGVM